MPFGLPERAPDPQPIIDTTTDNAGNLSVVVSALTDSLGKSLTSSQQIIDYVTGAVRSSLSARLGANTRKLNEVMANLGLALQSQLGTNQAELDSVQSAVDDTISGDVAPRIVPPYSDQLLGSGAAIAPVDSASRDQAHNTGIAVQTDSIGEQNTQHVDVTTVTVPVEDDSEDSSVEDDSPEPMALDIPEVPPVIHSTWLQRFTQMRDILVKFGDMVIAGNGNISGAMVTVLSDTLRVYGAKSETYDATVAHFNDIVNQKQVQAMLSLWQQSVANTLAQGSLAIRSLVAARSALTWLDSMRFGTHGANDAHAGIEGSLGLHIKAIGLGAGGNSSKSQDIGSAFRSEIHAVIVPALEVCDTAIAYELQQEPPTVAECEALWIRGYITDVEAETIVRCNGQHWLTVQAAMVARSEQLRPDQLIQYGRRHGWNQAQIDDLLRAVGVFLPGTRAQMQELYDQLPSIQDHLQWLRRNVFDAQYVQKYDLLNGFAQKFWPRFGDDLLAQGMLQKYAELHYAAHWIQPAPTQMLDFVYRLRKGKVAAGSEFTLDDYKNILAEQDYAPLARDWFAATAYQVPALSYLRDMYRQGVIDDAELKSYHQDLGYSEGDSDRFVQIDSILKVRDRRSKSQGWTPSALARAYGAGQLTALVVIAEMGQQGYTVAEATALMERATAEVQARITVRARSRIMFGLLAEVRDHIRTGIVAPSEAINLLLGAGYSEQLARSQVDIEIAEGRAVIVKAGINRLKSAYLSGSITLQQAEQSLGALQLTPQSIAQYAQLWSIMLTPKRKRRSASQVVESLAHGDLDRNQALAMLTNLGYDNADQQLYMADAQRAVGKLQSARLAAQQKQANSRAKALQSAAKAAATAKKQIVKDLKAEAPPATLKRWARLGIITKGDFYARFKLYGYPVPTIDASWLEACSAKGAACNDSATIATPLATVSGITGAATQ